MEEFQADGGRNVPKKMRWLTLQRAVLASDDFGHFGGDFRSIE